jgi:transposase
MAKVVFKQNLQNQPTLFPFSFDNFIDKSHPLRVLNNVIDKLDITKLIKTYKGGGTSSYHPRIMLKIIIYAYLNNIYSSRKIEKASKESIYYMWLSGQSFPDHNTINNFRGKKLKTEIENIFTQVVIMLYELNLLSFKEAFTDGTKIESAANRYTFVWRGSIEKNKQKLENKIQTVLEEINQAIKEDESVQEEEENVTITSEELQQKIESLNAKLSKTGASKKIVKKVEKLAQGSLTKLREYELHLKKMGNRNSYSKTDPDATFMRMKEDHMKNGQLKPAYNIQVSTENNFITNFSTHQNPTDTTTLKPHLLSYNDKYDCFPEKEITDAGYGSLENYDFLEEKGIENFVKYNYFYVEQSKKFKHNITRIENLHYNAEEDYFVCPMGQHMQPIEKCKRKSEAGYEYEVTIYQAKNCNRCPLNGACHKQKGNREIEVNKKLIAHKQKARENLISDIGIELRGRRCSEVEQTFGQIKWNKKFNRFLLRGLEKVNTEFGLIAIAHNIQKLHKAIIEGKAKAFLNFMLCLLKILTSSHLKNIVRKKNIVINLFENISPLKKTA